MKSRGLLGNTSKTPFKKKMETLEEEKPKFLDVFDQLRLNHEDINT
jgi:hypothetical protein